MNTPETIAVAIMFYMMLGAIVILHERVRRLQNKIKELERAN